MKSLILFIFVFSTTCSWADCYQKLTDNYNYDSAFFKVHTSEIKINENEWLDIEAAANALNKVYERLGCDKKATSAQVKCTEALNTILCRHDMKYGFFLITKDYVDTINLIFNRWD